MGRRRIAGIIFLFIALLLIAVFSVSSIGFGSDYQVHVRGHVDYNMISGWSVSVDDYDVEKDSLFAFWYMPWETKDVHVNVKIGNDEADSWIGTMSNIGGSKRFEVTVHNVPKGSHYGKVTVYEVEKEDVIPFVPIFTTEKTRKAQATCTFQVVV